MYNDFVLIGPKSDPAKVAGGKDILEALRKVEAAQGAVRVARRQAAARTRRSFATGRTRASISTRRRGRGIATPAPAWGRRSTPRRRMNAYILADRGTWLSFKNRGELAIARRRRQAPVQPVRRDARQSRQASERQEGARAGVHRLARVAARAGRDRGLQDRRRAAVLSRTPGPTLERRASPLDRQARSAMPAERAPTSSCSRQAAFVPR